jgi:membrane protein DedA with SNARE-associated domain/membrane-associated phospholipid phosphatase
LHSLLIYIGAHPNAALLITFLIAFLESVAIIGAVVPAAIVMFTAGALVGTGALDLWTTLAVATLGAVAGDGLSYELGRIYSGRIKTWKIFTRYSDAFNRAEDYVRRHGGKSILFARFVAPLRAAVPVMAGVAGMARSKFYLVNIASASIWAPVHILPGVLFGASIRVAEAVTARLALILIIVTALIWFVMWLVRVMARIGQPTIKRWRDHALSWAAQRPSWIARIVSYFLDSSRPESPILLLSAMLLLGSSWLFLAILEDVVGHESLAQLDVAIFKFFQALHIPAVNRIMVVIAEMGGAGVVLPLAVVALFWLITRRCWHTSVYWIAAVGFSQVLVELLDYTLTRERSLDLYSDRIIAELSFPTWHVTSSMVIYGFLAFLLCRKQPPKWRFAVTGITAIYLALIGFSRVYLGVHWFTNVLGGYSLGLAWIALLAMVYTIHQVNDNLDSKKMAAVVGISFLVFGTWYTCTHYWIDIARYTPEIELEVLSIEEWVSTAWTQVPLQRIDIGGFPEEPLPLQWADSVNNLAHTLNKTGWRAAPPWSLQTTLLCLTPDATAKDLPVLPKFNQGASSKLAFVYVNPKQPMVRAVLRLWRSGYAVRNPATAQDVPVWYGTVYREEFARPWHLFTIYVSRPIVWSPDGLDLPWPAQVKWVARAAHMQGRPQKVFFLLPQDRNPR